MKPPKGFTPDNFIPWLSFGMNEDQDFICYVNVLPSKPETAGVMMGTIVEHLIECYADQFGKDVTNEIWTGVIRVSLPAEVRDQYVHFPVQGDES